MQNTGGSEKKTSAGFGVTRRADKLHSKADQPPEELCFICSDVSEATAHNHGWRLKGVMTLLKFQWTSYSHPGRSAWSSACGWVIVRFDDLSRQLPCRPVHNTLVILSTRLGQGLRLDCFSCRLPRRCACRTSPGRLALSCCRLWRRFLQCHALGPGFLGRRSRRRLASTSRFLRGGRRHAFTGRSCWSGWRRPGVLLVGSCLGFRRRGDRFVVFVTPWWPSVGSRRGRGVLSATKRKQNHNLSECGRERERERERERDFKGPKDSKGKRTG